MYNLPEMRILLEWAEAGGDEAAVLDMRYYFNPGEEGPGSCGTTMCMGGFVAARMGVAFIPTVFEFGTPQERYVTCNWKGARHSVLDVAQAGLGLNRDEASTLFTEEVANQNEDVWAARSIDFLKHLIGRAEENPLSHMLDDEIDIWLKDWAAENLDD